MVFGFYQFQKTPCTGKVIFFIERMWFFHLPVLDMKYPVKEVKMNLVIFTFCCAGYGGVLACMSCRFCITPLLLQMSLTFSPYIMGGLEWRGQKLENNFTLVLNLKSDWKRNLLFRSSSCASTLSQVKKNHLVSGEKKTLSQVKKKTNHFEAFYATGLRTWRPSQNLFHSSIS